MRNYFKKMALLAYAILEKKYTLSIDLVQDCNTIATDLIPESCGADNLGFPRLWVIWAAGTEITAVGEAPTATEVQTALTAGLAFTSGRFSNGIKIAPELTTVSGADTIDGLDDTIKEVEGITGTLRNFDNDVLQVFAQNNLNNNRVQMAWVGDNGRWHGGKAGYQIPFYLPNFEHAGDGSSSGVNFSFKWKRNDLSYTDYTASDDDYLTVTNLAGS